MVNIFTDELAYSVARFSSYEKGKEYYKDGLVERIWRENEHFKAIVQGNHKYAVSMKFEDEEMIYKCNCPYELEGACKHVVAAIFAFSKEKKFNIEKQSPVKDKNKQTLDKLLNETTDSQLRAFTQKLLFKHPDFIDDLAIFIQGQKQTPISISQYKIKFKKQLDELDLSDLIEIWYSKGDDYYNEDRYGPYSETKELSDVVDEVIKEAEEYGENQNYGETLKIYQALFDALGEKKQTLKGEEEELEDWFLEEMDKVLGEYIEIFAKTNNSNLREIGISYLCGLFEKQQYNNEQYQISKGLRNIITSKHEADKALSSLLNILRKKNLTINESSLIVYLYFLIEDFELFEQISLSNLKENPSLVLDLLKYYQKNDRKEKTIEIAKRVLTQLSVKQRSDSNFSYFEEPINYPELEIQIRTFLKTVFSSEEDYQEMKNNLEQLFLKTSSLTDYKEVVKTYEESGEKNQLWQKMKDYFLPRQDVKTIFKVFRLENKKEEVLNLVETYPDADCFPDMVSFIQSDFPDVCFSAYKKKIEKILQVADVRKYKEAAYHLKRMKQIGESKSFADFIDWIKTTYRRRRKLMEELRSV